MLICVYADNHWSSYSSIIRSRGKHYSTRLENQIASVNWVERLAESRGCAKIISLGDFFDKAELNSEEVTALSDVEWSSSIPHTFIVGNHEISIGNSEYSTAHTFCMRQATVISEPEKEYYDDLELCYLPYTSNAKTLNEYFGEMEVSRRVVFSHNDIAGVQFGMYVSKDGIPLKSIETECDLFLNGHLHNRSDIGLHAGNIGNLTGQNFSEDAHIYDHCAVILDTDTLKCEFVENPYAFNFYKMDLTSANRDEICSKVSGLFKTSVLSLKVNDVDEQFAKEVILKNKNIIESRVIINYTATESDSEEKEQLVQLDHIQKFHDFVLQNIGTDDVIKEELSILCK